MSFRPSIHGWPFHNERSWDPSALGLGASPLPELGLGGGMCWAALDRYLSGVTIARDTPAPKPGDALYAELVRRQMSALSGVWDRVGRWGRPTSAWWAAVPGAGGDAAWRTRAEWRRARRRLQAGEPVLLTVLPEADAYTRGRAAWQVLALGWAKDGGRLRLRLYDPARPDDDEVHLSFSARGRLDARLTGGQLLRGFFVIPYDRDRGVTVRVETFADRAVLGLNRKVRGRVHGVARGKGLDLVARDPDSALVHFRRKGGSHWEGANVTGQEGLGMHELHSDPRAVLMGPWLHVFARDYVGDLLHFSLGRQWGFANLTDHRRTGPRFRLAGDPVPVAGSRLRLSVVARDRDDGLVHYGRSPLRGWSAEQVAGEPIVGDPIGAWVGSSLHVFAVTRDQRLMAWQRPAESPWVRLDLSTGRTNGPAFRLAGSPALLVDGNVLNLFGRDPNGRLVHFRRADSGKWTASVLADGITGDPATTRGPAGIHVFAPAGEQGLVHAWGNREWQSEDVVATRPTLGGGVDASRRLTAWGSARELMVFARQGPHTVVLAWRADTDWIATPLGSWTGVEAHHQPGDEPLLIVDGAGEPHLIATDGRGTIVHAARGEWVEPVTRVGPRDVARVRPTPPPVADAAPAEEPALPDPHPQPEAEAEPEEVLGVVEYEPEVEAESEVIPLPLLDDPEPVHTATEPMEVEGAETLETDPLPLLQDPVAEPPAEAAETDGDPEEEPETDDEVASAPLDVVESGDRSAQGTADGSGEAEIGADSEVPAVTSPVEPEPREEAEEAEETDPLAVIAAGTGSRESEGAGEGAGEEEDAGIAAAADVAGLEVEAEAEAESPPTGDRDPWEPELAETGAGELDGGSPKPERRPAASNGTAPPAEVDPEAPDEEPLPFLDFEADPVTPSPGRTTPEGKAAEKGKETAEAAEEATGGRKEFRWENVAASGERPERSDEAAAPEIEPMDLSLLESWPPRPTLRKDSKTPKKKKDGR